MQLLFNRRIFYFIQPLIITKGILFIITIKPEGPFMMHELTCGQIQTKLIMTKLIESFGETLRKLREEKDLPLRKVAHELDMDQSFLSKIERNERLATKVQVIRIADFFNVDANELLIQHGSDKVFHDIRGEKNAKEILKGAREKLKQYRKTKN
jgi:transcriptional regulator with XRE-family HTH domain